MTDCIHHEERLKVDMLHSKRGTAPSTVPFSRCRRLPVTRNLHGFHVRHVSRGAETGRWEQKQCQRDKSEILRHSTTSWVTPPIQQLTQSPLVPDMGMELLGQLVQHCRAGNPPCSTQSVAYGVASLLTGDQA